MFDLDNIEVPGNIDDYVKKGIALGIKKKKARKVKFIANTAAAVLITLFVLSVRTSPAFASYMLKVPGLEYLVRFINYDKGLQSAVENDFIQSINSSVTHEGITFTIKDAVIDKSKALIFYSIENKTNKVIEIERVKLISENGDEHKEYSSSWVSSRGNENEESKASMIELNFTDATILQDKLNIEIRLRDEDLVDLNNYEASKKKSMLASSWNFEITIDKEKIKSMEKSYVLNQSITIEGQIINFKKITITPTRMALEVEYDENNSKKIFGFDDIVIVDEKGEEWGTIMNGLSATEKDENHKILYFQSNYFNTPKELYIKASTLRAIDKDKVDVAVDLENKKLLKAPDERLKLRQININEKETSIIFNLEQNEEFYNRFGNFMFSGSFKDSAGNKYNQLRCETWFDSLEGTYNVNFVIDNHEKLKGPIYLELYNYPEKIKGDIKVKI